MSARPAPLTRQPVLSFGRTNLQNADQQISIASRSFETSEGRNVLASLDFSGHLMDAWPWETKRISWMGAQARVCQSALGGRELNHCLAVGKKNSKRAAPVRALVVPVCCERGLYLRILIGRIHDANAHPP